MEAIGIKGNFAFAGKPLRVALSGDHSIIAGADDAGSVKIWRADTGEERPSPPPFPPGVSALAFGDNGAHLVIALKDNALLWWNVKDGKEEARTSTGAYVGSAAVQPGGSAIALGMWDGFVRIWTPPTPLANDGLQHDLPTVNYVGFNEKGDRIASSVKSEKAYLWNVQSRKMERQFLVAGQQTRVASMSGSGTRIALWSADDSITFGIPQAVTNYCDSRVDRRQSSRLF